MRILTIFGLLLLAQGCAGADQEAGPTPRDPDAGFDAARLALEAERFEEAAGLYRAAAEQGHVAAQFSLGALHALGAGVSRDVDLALGWYEKSAERAGGVAQYTLAQRLEQGVPGRTDEKRSASWLDRLARLGEPTNPLRVGSDYLFGVDGLEADPERALDWYRRAAEQPHVMAWYRLGQMYAGGIGVEGDHVRAHMWFTLCAELGLGDSAAWKREVEGLMSAEQLAQSAQLVRDWKETTPAPDPLPPMPQPRPSRAAGH